MEGGVAVRREISKGQVKKIHALKNALQLSDDDYRKLIYVNFYPANSSRQLSFEQAEIFIKHLEPMAIEKGVWTPYKGQSAYEDLGYREGMASPAQLRKIEAVWKDISAGGGGKARKKALRNWLHKYFGVSDLRFLSTARVNDVIHALGKIKKRKCPELPESHFRVFHDRSACEL
jgi:hypothetical protein